MSSIAQSNPLQTNVTTPVLPANTRPADSASTQVTDDSPVTQVSVSDSARLLARAESDAPGTDAPAPAVQSFVYGALGLERPEEQVKTENGYYSAGKWLAAAATVGTMVSLLV